MASEPRAPRDLGTTTTREVSAEQVGAKAFNLITMRESGLPVPPGFVLGTEYCRDFQEAGGHLDGSSEAQVTSSIREIERHTGLLFGGARRPLLLAVRSGAAVSMPGMLESILNVGLSDATVPGLLRATGDPVFVWDSYRRLVQAYAEVVAGCPSGPFVAVLSEALAANGVPSAGELDVAALKAVVRAQQAVYRSLTGRPFPQDPFEQLLGAVAAVLRSWNGERAVRYRDIEGLNHLAGTAVTVQAMVFGNKGATSGAGVAFTRDPSTGEDRLYVDFLLNSQGEDVVAGRHLVTDAEPVVEAVPGLGRELQSVRRKLEGLFRDAQDFEFTVEEGKLWLLQSRPAKRTPWAALQIACDLVDEGLIEPATAVERLGAYELGSIARTRMADEPRARPLVRGTPASDGVASGRMALGIGAARRFFADGDQVVLVRDQASTEDIAAFAICRAVVTAAGARTSHAAVVARQLGAACVVGCHDVFFDAARPVVRIGEDEVREGEPLTVDGATGCVYRGEHPVCVEHPDDMIERVRSWQAGRSGREREEQHR